MSALANQNQQKGNALPLLLPSTLIHTQWAEHTKQVEAFNFSCPKFASLATKEELKALNPIEIDITEELSLLTDSSMLEITLPVFGINDLLSNHFGHRTLNFPTVVALNGYGAKGADDPNDNFARPDFVRLTDIVGNQYEVVVNQDGKIELPENGTGLFSVPQALTFIYDKRQIVDGFGFEDVTSDNILKNKIYLQLPTHTLESLSPYICITHLNEDNRRIVDSIRRISIKFDDLPLTLTEQGSCAKRYDADIPELLCVDVSLSTSHQDFGGAFNLSISLEPIKGVGYSPKNLMKPTLPIETNGWRQHPILSNVFTKHFGLSKSALKQFINQIYSEFDFMRDCLQGDTFNLSVKNGYNQFLIHPQAFPKCYDLLVHDLIGFKIPGNFLMDRISDDRLTDLDLNEMDVDFHDSVVLTELMENLRGYRVDALGKLFLQDKPSGSKYEVSDYFYVYAQGSPDKLPAVTVSITQGRLFSKNLIASIEANVLEKHAKGKKGKNKNKEGGIEKGNLEMDEIFDTREQLILPTHLDFGLTKESSNEDANQGISNKSDDNETSIRLKSSQKRTKYTPNYASDTLSENKKSKEPKKPIDQGLKRPPQR